MSVTSFLFYEIIIFIDENTFQICNQLWKNFFIKNIIIKAHLVLKLFRAKPVRKVINYIIIKKLIINPVVIQSTFCLISPITLNW